MNQIDPILIRPYDKRLTVALQAAKAKAQGKPYKHIKKPTRSTSRAKKAITKPVMTKATKMKATKMMYIYDELLSEYLRKPSKSLASSKTTLFHFFVKAAGLADSVQIDYYTFIKAQFYFMDKWFNKYPKVFQLVTTKGKCPAEWRAREYLKINIEEYEKKIRSVSIPHEISNSVIDKANLKLLNQLKTLHSTDEKEVLLQFADDYIFDYSWLRKRSIYKQLKRENLL